MSTHNLCFLWRNKKIFVYLPIFNHELEPYNWFQYITLRTTKKLSETGMTHGVLDMASEMSENRNYQEA